MAREEYDLYNDICYMVCMGTISDMSEVIIMLFSMIIITTIGMMFIIHESSSSIEE
jgi:hypothetical protein